MLNEHFPWKHHAFIYFYLQSVTLYLCNKEIAPGFASDMDSHWAKLGICSYKSIAWDWDEGIRFLYYC